MESTNNDDQYMDGLLTGDEFDTDMELFEMRKAYNELKRERQKTEKNAKILENKVKLLEGEEKSVKVTLTKQVRYKNEMIRKMAELKSAKEEVIRVL